jgi:CDP-glucose 4,6-dehydratase
MQGKTMNRKFWKGKKVFLTGASGFKGSWLSVWLISMGAKVTGYALKAPTKPSLFTLLEITNDMKSVTADIRDFARLKKELLTAKPEIVIHMAAQPLVRDSYRNPSETYETNILGTVNLFEAVRACKSVRAVLNVTTDKVYENKEIDKAYKEGECLGGYDPYSASKACSEIVTASYRDSFFNPKNYKRHRVAVATARAGNVIGGGDWASDRLVPDFVRAVLSGGKIEIRNPGATRPWQHVLDPLNGYLMLCEKLYNNGQKYAGAWNIGPDSKDCKSVGWIAQRFCELWGSSRTCSIQKGKHPHEAHFLKLDNSKAKKQLGWHPKWDINEAVARVVEWTKAYEAGINAIDICKQQIKEFQAERK